MAVSFKFILNIIGNHSKMKGNFKKKKKITLLGRGWIIEGENGNRRSRFLSPPHVF